MPTTLSTFAANEATMRYREPYVTEGLNKKLAVTVPAGIYRGFRLGTNVTALNVTVSADPTDTDHVAGYRTQGGFALTIRKTGGDFSLDLTSFTSKTVVVAIFATYGVGFTTTAEIRAYELSPSDTFTGASENSELIVLGTVVVPASGVIPGANISHDRRRSAWASQAPEAVPWSPILKNGGFEHGVTNEAMPRSISDWILRTDLAVNSQLTVAPGVVRSGGKSLEFTCFGFSACVQRLEQYQEIPVTSGQLLLFVGYVKQLVSLLSGSYTFNLYWGDEDSAATSSTSIVLSATGTDADFRKVAQIITVPTNTFFLKTVTLEVAASPSGLGNCALFDDFQLFVETASPLAQQAVNEKRLRNELLAGLVLEDPSTYALGELAALLRFDKATPASEGSVVVERRDQSPDPLSALPPALSLFGRIINLGSELLGDVNTLKPRVSAPVSTLSGSPFTLLWESTPGALKAIRLYVGDLRHTAVTQPALFLTVNASYNGTSWVKDVNGQISTGLYLEANTTNNRLLTLYRQDSPDTWASAAWLDELRYYPTGSDGNLVLTHNASGFNIAAASMARILLGVGVNATDTTVGPLIDINLGNNRRTNMMWCGTGDVVGVQTFDQHGKIFSVGRLVEEDFEGKDITATSFVRTDFLGASIVTYGASVLELTSGASSGDNSAIMGQDEAWAAPSEGGPDLGFRMRYQAVNLTHSLHRLGFWDPTVGVIFDPVEATADLGLNGFKIDSAGVVHLVYNDSGGTHVVSTGVTITNSEVRYYSMYYDPNNALIQWHISVPSDNMFLGYQGGTYGTVSADSLTGGDGAFTLFFGVKTTSASSAVGSCDYISAWTSFRN